MILGIPVNCSSNNWDDGFLVLPVKEPFASVPFEMRLDLDCCIASRILQVLSPQTPLPTQENSPSVICIHISIQARLLLLLLTHVLGGGFSFKKMRRLDKSMRSHSHGFACMQTNVHWQLLTLPV